MGWKHGNEYQGVKAFGEQGENENGKIFINIDLFSTITSYLITGLSNYVQSKYSINHKYNIATYYINMSTNRMRSPPNRNAIMSKFKNN